MRDIWYTELRKIVRDIKANEDTSVNTDKVLLAIKEGVELANLSRAEGLLALEARVSETRGLPREAELYDIILLICDGVDPESLEEICLATYFSSDLTGIDALIHIIYTMAALAIQIEENPYVIEKRLLALIPADMRLIYQERVQDEEEKRESIPDEEIDVRPIEKWYNGKSVFLSTDEGYYIEKALEYILLETDDRGIQRWLRDVDNSDLALLMRGVSGQTRQIIFKNMSKRLAIMIAEDMEHIGNVRILEITKAIQKTLNVLLQLITYGAITCPDNEVLLALSELFRMDAPKEPEPEKQNKLDALENLFQAYKTKGNRIISL